MGGAEGWRPFEEIVRGDIREGSFVVQLWVVHRGCPGGSCGDVDSRYLDPARFFERTYFTRGLRDTLRSFLLRVTGRGGEPVYLLYTGFGGGKSHTLLSMYYLARRPREALASRRLRRFLEEVGVEPGELESLQAAVSVFDGAAVDPYRLRTVYKAPTLWYYVMRELAGYSGSRELERLVEQYRLAPPGVEAVGEFLSRLEAEGFAPVVLIDELAMYMRHLEVRGDPESKRELDGLRIFLHSLSVAAANSSRSVVAIATPQQYEEESKRIAAILSDVKRVAAATSLIERRDAAEILKAALIEWVDEAAARRVAEEYRRLYQSRRQWLPQEALRHDYAERIAASYPFHPYLVDVLYGELAAVPGFQGTRDILRIVAKALHARYQRDRVDLVLLGDLDATRPEILDEMLVRNENLKRLRDAVSYDIEEVRRLDEERRRQGLPPVAGLVYSAVLVRSAAGKPSSVEEVALGASTPLRGVDPPVVPQVLEELIHRTAHLHRFEKGGETYYIVKTRANVYVLLKRIAGDILAHSPERAREKLLEKLQLYTKAARGCRVVVWPRYTGEVPDDDRLNVVLLDPEDERVMAGESSLEELLQEFSRYSGGSNPRRNRNMVVYLVPDVRMYNTLLKAAAQLLAALQLRNPETARTYGLERDDLDELTRVIHDLNQMLSTDAAVLYGKLYYPVDARPDGSLVFEAATVNQATTRREGFCRAVLETLRERGKLVENIAETYLLRIAAQRYEALRRPLRLEDLVAAFTEDPRSVILLHPSERVARAASSLLEKGLLAALQPDGKTVCMKKLRLDEKLRLVPCTAPEAREACIVEESAEGLLECRPKPPRGCTNPLWDSEKRRWICRAEPIAEEHTAAPTAPVTVETAAPSAPAPGGLELEDVSPPEAAEKLRSTADADKPVELLLVRTEAVEPDDRLVASVRALIQALATLRQQAPGYRFHARLLTALGSPGERVTIDAETASPNRLAQLLNVARGLGAGRLSRLVLEAQLTRASEQKPITVKQLADTLSWRSLSNPSLRLKIYIETGS